jgi:hypothetical protein
MRTKTASKRPMRMRPGKIVVIRSVCSCEFYTNGIFIMGTVCEGFRELPIFADGEFEEKCRMGSGGGGESADNGRLKVG